MHITLYSHRSEEQGGISKWLRHERQAVEVRISGGWATESIPFTHGCSTDPETDSHQDQSLVLPGLLMLPKPTLHPSSTSAASTRMVSRNMAAFVPGFPAVPKDEAPASPFGWELVRVLDPRVEGRTMILELMTKEIRVPDHERPPTASGVVPFKTRKIVVSPLVSYNDPSAIYEIIDFKIVDPRFVVSTVQICFTIQEAILFHQAMQPAHVAQTTLNSRDKIIRLKCYVHGCTVTTSKMEKLQLHFLNDHPDAVFQVQQVKLYQLGGQHDRKFLNISTRYTD